MGQGAPKNISHIFFFEKEKIGREGMFEMGLGGILFFAKGGFRAKIPSGYSQSCFSSFPFPKVDWPPKRAATLLCSSADLLILLFLPSLIAVRCGSSCARNRPVLLLLIFPPFQTPFLPSPSFLWVFHRGRRRRQMTQDKRRRRKPATQLGCGGGV